MAKIVLAVLLIANAIIVLCCLKMASDADDEMERQEMGDNEQGRHD